MSTKKLSTINNYLKSKVFINKNVLITGATGGIGSEVLKKFLLCGSKVVGLAHNLNEINRELINYFNILSWKIFWR